LDGKYNNYIIIITILVILNGVQTASAERIIDFEKVLDIDKNSLEKYFKNIRVLEDVFPQNIKNIQSMKQTDDGNLFKVSLNMKGISLATQVLYKESENRHLLKVLDGDLKGTTITATLQKTWGFDGSQNQGTVVNVKTSLKASGFLSLVNLLPDKSILYTLDYSLANIVADSNGENISKDHDARQDIKKGHRVR